MVKRKLALERTKYLIEYFADDPCVDCGEGGRKRATGLEPAL